MPRQLRTRDQALDDVTRALHSYGFEGATLSRLQAASGLKPSSLYNYFPGGKEEMAAAALGRSRAAVREAVAAALVHEGPADQQLRILCNALARLYDGGRGACLMNLFGVGDSAERLAGPLKDWAEELVGALASIVATRGVWPDEARRRAEDGLIAIQGALVVSRALASTEPFERTMRELPGRML